MEGGEKNEKLPALKPPEVKEEHLEIGGQKITGAPKTIEALKKAEALGIGEQTSGHELEAIQRAAQSARKIEKLRKSGN